MRGLGRVFGIRPDQGAAPGACDRKAEEGDNAERWRPTTTRRACAPDAASPARSERHALGARSDTHENHGTDEHHGGRSGPSGYGGPDGPFGHKDHEDQDHEDPGARGFRSVRAASTTALAGLVAVGLFVTACSTGGTGSRDEGAARADEPASAPAASSPSASAGQQPSKRVDPIALIKSDPKIGERLKEDLKPCVADAYPVDTSYGNLTGGTSPDVVVNVMTCGDAVGIGTYVYREENDRYKNVFMAEDAAVYATIDRGDLVVTKQVYAKGDPVAYPSGEDVITYRWSGNRFTQHDWVHNDYSRALGDGGIDPAPAPSGGD